MNVRVDLNYPIKDGTEVVFRSPVDCSQVTGLKVYYNDNGNTASKEFAFADAHGNNVGDIDHLFAENVAVKVILDVTTGMAFVQNADTNAYLEGRFAAMQEQLDNLDPSGGGGGITDEELAEKVPEIVADDMQNYGATYDALASVMNREVMDGDGDIAGAIWIGAMDAHEDAFYSDMEMYGFLSYDEENGYLPNVYTKEDVEQLVAEGKAIVFNVANGVSDMTSQQVHEEVLKGKIVYLNHQGDYVSCVSSNGSEAVFENSYIASNALAADGNKYNTQLFKLYRIGTTGKYSISNLTIPEKGYIDAMATYEPQYELIQSFTITEDGTKRVYLENFELDKFVVYVTAPIAEEDFGTNFYVDKGEENVFYCWANNMFSKSKDNNPSAFYGKNENGIAFIEFAASSGTSKAFYTVPQYIEGINPFTKIRFVLSGTSENIFPVGTKFELWGVRR